MARSTEEGRLACPGKVKGGAGLAVGRQGCGSQLVAAIPRRVLLHVPRFIGNNGSARSTCGAQGGRSGVPSLTARPRGAPGGPAPPPAEEMCRRRRPRLLFSQGLKKRESLKKVSSNLYKFGEAGCALHGSNGILGVVDSSSSCTIINQMQRWHSLITGGHRSPCGFSERRTFVNNNTSALLNICDAPLPEAAVHITTTRRAR